MKFKTTNILGFDVHQLRMEELLNEIDIFIKSKQPHTITLVNPWILLEARKNSAYAEYIRDADLVTADGVGLLIAGWLFGGAFPERVTGSDLMPILAERAEKNGYKLYFLGAAEGIAEEAANKLRKCYPELKIVGTRHGFFNNIEEQGIISDVIAKKPDILIVCMGAVYQEMFIKKNLKEMNVPVCFGNGAAFDFVSQRVKRAPRWVQKIGLEWFFRLLQEPRRLWKRYLVGNLVFTWLILGEVIKKRFFRKANLGEVE